MRLSATTAVDDRACEQILAQVKACDGTPRALDAIAGEHGLFLVELQALLTRAAQPAPQKSAPRPAPPAAPRTRVCSQCATEAQTEHGDLKTAANQAGRPDAATARLRPGPRRSGEAGAVDRLDVARCQTCHTHHDAAHECPGCGEVTPAEPSTFVKPWKIRAWAAQQGLDVPTRGPIPAAVAVQYHEAQEAAS